MKSNLTKKLTMLASVFTLASAIHSASATVIAGPITNPANAHSYYLLGQTTWADGEAEAVTLGGHLVTINDADEDFWVFSTFGFYGSLARNLWIGATDAVTPGDVDWSSGETTTYSYWSVGNPDGTSGTPVFKYGPQNVQPGRWNDHPDTDQIMDFGAPFQPIYAVVEVGSTIPATLCDSAILTTVDAPVGLTTFAKLYTPIINESCEVAFQGILKPGGTVTSANATGLFFQTGTGIFPVVRAGDPIPGVSGTTFAKFYQPLLDDEGDVAFMAPMKTVVGLVDATNNQGLWWYAGPRSTDAIPGGRMLVARKGFQAPGCAPGELFKTIEEAVLRNSGGPAFRAVLSTGKRGVWRTDSAGTVSLICLTGSSYTLPNATTKTISAITFLDNPTRARSQTRHAKSGGELAILLGFTDKTQAIVRVP